MCPGIRRVDLTRYPAGSFGFTDCGSSALLSSFALANGNGLNTSIRYALAA